jgi:hypothetical protein
MDNLRQKTSLHKKGQGIPKENLKTLRSKVIGKIFCKQLVSPAPKI